MSFVIFDLEYTTWKGCQENGWKRNQKKEIVQISALKISDRLKVLDEFNSYCQPKINPILSDYFENLTGITNQFIQKNGISFSEAYKKFKKFVSNDACFSHSWGKPFYDLADGNIIQENLQLYNLPKDSSIRYYNIAEWFKNKYQEAQLNKFPESSGKIAKVLGKEKILTHLGLDEHNALYDVYSILEGIKSFTNQFKIDR